MYGFDFTDSGEKETCRRRNVAALQGSRHIVSQTSRKLQLDWLELAGLGAPTHGVLADSRMLGDAGKFIGVDIEPSVIEGLKNDDRINRTSCEFHHGSFDKLVTKSRHLFGKVGVLNLDTTHGWQGDRRPPIVEECAVATEFIVSRLLPENPMERAAREFLFIVNGYVRKAAEVLPTIDRSLAPLRSACKALKISLRAANLISYPSRGRTSEMINLALAIGY